ncbi:hypothetical protein Tco_0184757 [Tanacetum coccineum]
MENANPPPPNNPHILPTVLRAKVVQEFHALSAISAFIDSRLKNIEQFLNGFAPQANEIDMNEVESNDELLDTPLVSPFLDSDSDSDDGEVLNELYEYGNVGTLRRRKAHLLEDKQIPNVGVFDEDQDAETPSGKAQTTSGMKRDAVWKILMSSGSAVK